LKDSEGGVKMKLKFNWFKRRIIIVSNSKTKFISVVKKPEMETGGITSRCTDGLHVIFLDYDNIERWIIEDELKLLQHYYKLTPFYLFTTKEETSEVSKNLCGNYHAICISKFPIQKVSEIQDRTHIDWKYKGAFRISRYKTWVLRQLPKGERDKPQYLGLVGKHINLDNEVSQAHLSILKTIHDIDIIDYKNLDGLTETFLTTYNTAVK